MNSTVSAGTCKQHTGTRTIGCTVRQKKKKTRAHDVHDAAGPCRCMTPAGHRVFSRHHQLITRCSDDQSWLTIQLLARVQLCCVRVLRAMAAALL